MVMTSLVKILSVKQIQVFNFGRRPMTTILNGDNFVVIGKDESTLFSNDNCSNGVSGNHFNGKHSRLPTAGRSDMLQFQRNDDYNTNSRISSGKYVLLNIILLSKKDILFSIYKSVL